MNQRLPARGNVPGKLLRIEISGEQRNLIEHEAGGPDCRRAAEPGQNDFRDQWFERKKKKAAEEYRRPEDGHAAQRSGVDLRRRLGAGSRERQLFSVAEHAARCAAGILAATREELDRWPP